jgi:hypothetical protein
MKRPTILDDIAEVRREWHDPEYRKGFMAAFIPRAIIAFVVNAVVAAFLVSTLMQSL